MKIQFGVVQNAPQSSQIGPNWQRIHSPNNRTGFLLAGLVGLSIPFLFVVILVMTSLIGTQPEADESPSWLAVILAFVLFVPVHELIHAICYPNWGLTDETILIIVPKKVRIGVYFDGCMSRKRWIIMRLAPFIVLSIIPLILLSLFQFIPAPHAFDVFLQVLMLANGIGSGGDLIAVGIVMKQVPPANQICFKDGLAYWHR